ncbi:hypothetical protein OIO90_000624 [Microbotryomycetes sp. JL221]|nr:hypothetical protein OIO90_000624 [Microbotryomycetes sp. JL221]
MGLVGTVCADSVSLNDPQYNSGEFGVAPVQAFASAPFQPPRVNILVAATEQASTNYTFLGYRGTAAAQPAPLILDNQGSLVWSGAEFGNSMDFKVQTLFGEPVLTFFNGSFYSGGYGYGHWEVLGQNYSSIRTVDGLNQTADQTDFHEFVITPNNTALVESWRLLQTDLSSVNGPSDGWTWDCVFQEINLSTNELMFEWRSLEHVPVEETYFSLSGDEGSSQENAWDYCHINSVDKDDLGNYIVSLRGPSTVYYIDGQSGEVMWRLGGKSTSFTMGDGSVFWYQHDARLRSDPSQSVFNVSLFDNAAGGDGDVEPTARAIMLELDTDTMEASLLWALLPSFNGTAPSQGDTQILSNGNVVVGWGAIPQYSEYNPNGDLIHDVRFAVNSSVQSYRAYKQAWQGYPLTKPSIAVNESAVAVSWNGATEVQAWALLTGPSASNLSTMNVTNRTGFETLLSLTGSPPVVAAAALARNGTCLSVSNAYYAANSSDTREAPDCPQNIQLGAGGNGQPQSGASTHTVRWLGSLVSLAAFVLLC